MSRLCCKFLLDCSFVKIINTRRCIATGVSQLRSQHDSPTSEQKNEGGGGGERQSVSKAMHAYLERAEAHHTFMKEQEEEFVLGRRHLANMMGKDPENFTQYDINEAIRYLFPSGLFQKKARPMMKHPSELYPKQKAAEFDISGRPHHPFFYTSKPNFFVLIHEIANKINNLNAVHIPEGAEPPEEVDTFMKGTKWISKIMLEDKLLEKLSDTQFTDWTTTIDRLADHPLHGQEFEFLKQYRIPLADLTKQATKFPVTLLPDGRKSVTIVGCFRKRSQGNITVTIPGTGQILIDGRDLEWFKRIQDREIIISPLQKARLLGQVDVDVTMQKQKHEEGPTNLAHIVRYGIAHGVVALGAESEPLRLAGYLTHDLRKKERQQPGHDSARKPWKYKRR